MTLTVINPTTGNPLREFTEMTPAKVNEIIEHANQAFQAWKRYGFDHRAGLMRNAAALLKENKKQFAYLMAEEMGKPLKQGISEAEKCAWVCEYYADNAAEMLQPQQIPGGHDKNLITFQPLGVILAIMPWNFPFWQVFRFAAPTLMAGNTAVLKHASNVPQCALAIEEIFREAGFDDHVFRTLLISSKEINAVIENPWIRAVSLTGSTDAGKAVAAKAGSLVKKCVLELGGSDAYLVLEDADLEKAADLCVTSRLVNTGQSCIAAKRFIVVEEVYDRFCDLVVERMQNTVMGDPVDEETDIGPMARLDLRDDLHAQVGQSLKHGAKCLTGGEIPEDPGAFYPPTVLVNVKPGMRAWDEELFGPVAVIIPVRDEAEGIEVANATTFGLGAAVFTGNADRGERIATSELEAGCCFVNDFVKSDPRMPFGGIKESGYGRELSQFGIHEFVNIKAVAVNGIR